MQYKVLFMAFSNNSGVSFDNIYIFMFNNKYVVMIDNFIQVGKSLYFFFIHIVDNSVNNSFGSPLRSFGRFSGCCMPLGTRPQC